VGTLLFLATLVTLIGIYSIAALALNVQFGYGGIINFGVAAFFAAGAYGYALTVLPKAEEPYSYVGGFSLPIPLGVLAAGLAAAALALVVGLPTLRLRGEYLAVVTFALAEMIRHLFMNAEGIANGNRGLFNIPVPGYNIVPGKDHAYFLMGLVVALLVVVFFVINRLTRSPFGRSLLAIRENEAVAESIGKGSYGFRLRAFVFSSFFYGLAGALYVWYLTVLSPGAFSVDITFTIWIGAIIGGLGSNVGAVLGITILIGAREAVTYFKVGGLAPETLSSLQIAAQGLVLILILLFWRSGLLPRRLRSYGARDAPSPLEAEPTPAAVGGPS
jgi:branched-chain amino acid transport system permease protein